MANKSQSRYTSIPVEPATRERLKRMKRGGETWSRLLDKMSEQYNPDEHDY